MRTLSRDLSRSELIEAIKQEGQLSSTATVMLHALVAQKVGLGPSDHKCADILFRSGPMTAGDLAAHTGLTTGAITGIIDRLEKGGFVHRDRDPDDRRRVVVSVVRDSARIQEMRAIFAPLARAIRELASGYTDQELVIILDYLVRSRAIVEHETAHLQTLQ